MSQISRHQIFFLLDFATERFDTRVQGGRMPLLAGETKAIVFSDFDGTITLNDSNGKETLGLRVKGQII